MPLGFFGEKVGHYSEEKEEPLEINGQRLPGVYIRWLIGPKEKAPNFAMRVIRMEPGATIPRHKHPWEHEQFILEGEGVFIIGDRSYPVRPGYYVYIPPNVEHEYRNTGSRDLVFLCLVPLSTGPTGCVEEERS